MNLKNLEMFLLTIFGFIVGNIVGFERARKIYDCRTITGHGYLLFNLLLIFYVVYLNFLLLKKHIGVKENDGA